MNASAFRQEDIMQVLLRFYARVRCDPDLGPVFHDIVEDWPKHLQQLKEFWSSLMLAGGRYKGNPVAMHAAHAYRIQPQLFARWLQLWEETTNDMVPAAIARDMQTKAARIAERLKRAMYAPDTSVFALSSPNAALPQPYQTSTVFDHETVATCPASPVPGKV